MNLFWRLAHLPIQKLFAFNSVFLFLHRRSLLVLPILHSLSLGRGSIWSYPFWPRRFFQVHPLIHLPLTSQLRFHKSIWKIMSITPALLLRLFFDMLKLPILSFSQTTWSRFYLFVPESGRCKRSLTPQYLRNPPAWITPKNTRKLTFYLHLPTLSPDTSISRAALAKPKCKYISSNRMHQCATVSWGLCHRDVQSAVVAFATPIPPEASAGS